LPLHNTYVNLLKVGGRGQEAGGRRQEAGGRRQEVGELWSAFNDNFELKIS